MYPDARNPFAHPELLAAEALEPWSIPQLWIMARPDPNVFVDITEVMDEKIKALCSHTSQISDTDRIETLLRDWAAANADVGRARRRLLRRNVPRRRHPLARTARASEIETTSRSVTLEWRSGNQTEAGDRGEALAGARPGRAGVLRLEDLATRRAERGVLAETVERVTVDVAVDPVGDPLEPFGRRGCRSGRPRSVPARPF